MTEYLVQIWSMIIMGQNKFLDPALCGGSLPGLVSKFCIIFVFYDTFK